MSTLDKCTGCGRRLGAKSNPTRTDDKGLKWHQKCLEFNERMRTHGDVFRS